jgi:hypothetical protein
MWAKIPNCIEAGVRIIAIALLLLGVTGLPACGQEAADTAATAPVQPQPSWSAGEVIELDAVQIEGEIAQPNVTITVARQEPLFRELTLERTPAQGLMDLEITAPDETAIEAAKIQDWSEMLERPRQ